MFGKHTDPECETALCLSGQIMAVEEGRVTLPSLSRSTTNKNNTTARQDDARANCF